MWLPGRNIFVQGEGLVMEAIFWEVTKFLLFCFCFFFSVEWRFSHLSFTSWTVRFAFPTAFTCFVISSHICFFYLLVMLFVNFDWIISIFLHILSVYERYFINRKIWSSFPFGLTVSISITSFSAIFLSCTFFLRAKCKCWAPNIQKTGLSGLNRDCH